jgi:hypothetical protein
VCPSKIILTSIDQRNLRLNCIHVSDLWRVILIFYYAHVNNLSTWRKYLYTGQSWRDAYICWISFLIWCWNSKYSELCTGNIIYICNRLELILVCSYTVICLRFLTVWTSYFEKKQRLSFHWKCRLTVLLYPPENKMQAMVNFMYADELPSIPVLPSFDLLPQKECGGLHNGQTIAWVIATMQEQVVPLWPYCFCSSPHFCCLCSSPRFSCLCSSFMQAIATMTPTLNETRWRGFCRGTDIDQYMFRKHPTRFVQAHLGLGLGPLHVQVSLFLLLVLPSSCFAHFQ